MISYSPWQIGTQFRDSPTHHNLSLLTGEQQNSRKVGAIHSNLCELVGAGDQEHRILQVHLTSEDRRGRGVWGDSPPTPCKGEAGCGGQI